MPLLIVAAGLAPKEATGTSLAVIVITASFAAIVFTATDEVRWADAALVGIPALAGTLGGTWLQQRVSSRALVLLFAALLLAVAARLFVS